MLRLVLVFQYLSTLGVASAITSPLFPEPTQKYRNPLFTGFTLDSANISGSTTIWAAHYEEAFLPVITAAVTNVTVTDVATSIFWTARTEWRHPDKPAKTIIDDSACRANSAALELCVTSATDIRDGTTTTGIGTLTGDLLGPLRTLLPVMTVTNGSVLWPTATNISSGPTRVVESISSTSHVASPKSSSKCSELSL
jgi:hypothetical protein